MKTLNTYIAESLKRQSSYKYFPKTRDELKELVKKLIKERGNEADLNDIDTSEITDMADVFYELDFNGDISQWDVSNVTDMSSMFSSCKSFNQDISNWDVSKVTDMRYMFSRCKSFNQNVSKWNVSKVKKYDNIFFNCPIEEKYKPKKFKYYEKYI